MKSADKPMVAVAVMTCGEALLLQEMVNVLDSVVDKWILLQGSRTWDGELNSLTRTSAQWKDRLRPTGALQAVTAALPPCHTPAQLRTLQRNAIARGLDGVVPSATVAIVDSDTFLDPNWLAAYRASEPQFLTVTPMWGFLNRKAGGSYCCKGCDLPGGFVKGGVVGQRRFWSGMVPVPQGDAATAQVAGWHLGFVLSQTKSKLARNVHDYSQPQWQPEALSRALVEGRHPLGWWKASPIEIPHPLAPMAKRYGRYVL